MKNEYITTPEEDIKLAIEAIGQTIIDKAEELSKDIDDVTKITIHSDIGLDKVLDVEISKREKIAKRYRMHLEGVEGVQLNQTQKNVCSNYAYFPVVFDEKKFGSSRNEVFNVLEQNGIHARKYFYPLTNTFDCFHGKYNVDLTPVARHISKRILTLPLYADLPLEVVDQICEIVLNCKR